MKKKVILWFILARLLSYSLYHFIYLSIYAGMIMTVLHWIGKNPIDQLKTWWLESQYEFIHQT